LLLSTLSAEVDRRLQNQHLLAYSNAFVSLVCRYDTHGSHHHLLTKIEEKCLPEEGSCVALFGIDTDWHWKPRESFWEEIVVWHADENATGEVNIGKLCQSTNLITVVEKEQRIYLKIKVLLGFILYK
jgi:hypothetical protein